LIDIMRLHISKLKSDDLYKCACTSAWFLHDLHMISTWVFFTQFGLVKNQKKSK
jgi:hypothetical protein